MAMASMELTASLGVFKRNDNKYYDSDLVDYLADPDHWQMSVVT